MLSFCQFHEDHQFYFSEGRPPDYIKVHCKVCADCSHRDVSNRESDLEVCNKRGKANDCIQYKHQHAFIEDLNLVLESLERLHIANYYD